jgi:hypothetical protein
VQALKTLKESALQNIQDFDTQGIANTLNTLWAYSTMGTKPGVRMMGHLERRAEAI